MNTVDRPRDILNFARDQFDLVTRINAQREEDGMDTSALVLSLADYTLARLESLSQEALVGGLQSSCSILNLIWEQVGPRNPDNETRRRIRHVALRALDAVVPGSAFGACTATADVDSHFRGIVANARASFVLFTGGSAKKYADTEGQDEKLGAAEQVIVFLRSEYTRFVDLTDVSDVHACESCFWILRARVSPIVRTYLTETCAELQASIIDTIEDPSLRQRRSAANKSIDAFLGLIEGMRASPDTLLSDLNRLSEI
ncbi:hypothetical protein HDU80_005544 [Chytriomyces hyalinus]|nr:hypothetical protein HDU80_005544 [Chytriomyces hyalinus]